MKKRNFRIDIIKVICLLGIILAHVRYDNLFYIQIRGFDVVTMVFVSGYLSFNSFKSSSSYISYILKRIKRLVIPTWIFLSIFFLILLFNKYVFHLDFPYTLRQIKDSYLLIEGIGYVWIVRVYLLSALLVPLFIKLLNKLNIKIIYVLIFALLILNELLGNTGLYSYNFFTTYYVAYIIPYGIITLMGLAARKTTRDNMINLSLLFLIICLGLFIYYNKDGGDLILTNTKKYPPMLYYMSYGLFFSYMAMSINLKIKLGRVLTNIISFISSSSFWIYLWHIFSIYLVNLLIPDYNWKIRYTLIILIAVLITYLQNLIIKTIEKKNISLNSLLTVFKG